MRSTSINLVLFLAIPVMAQLPVTNGGTGVSKAYLPYPQGIVMNSLANQTGTATGVAGTSGSIASAVTYYCACAALDAYGFAASPTSQFGVDNVSTISASVTTSGSGTDSIQWTCPAVTGASGYRFYVSNSPTFLSAASARHFDNLSNVFTETTVFTSGSTLGSLKGTTLNRTGMIVPVNTDAVNLFYDNGTNGGDINITAPATVNAALGIFFNTSAQLAVFNPSTGVLTMADSAAGNITLQDNNVAGKVQFTNFNNSTSAYFDADDNLWLVAGSNEVSAMGSTTNTAGMVLCLAVASTATTPPILGHCTTNATTTCTCVQ